MSACQRLKINVYIILMQLFIKILVMLACCKDRIIGLDVKFPKLNGALMVIM